jgi:hypothetical protein
VRRHLVPAACLAVAALTLLHPSTPGYDPWAWLVWGQEVAHADLDTTAGPAWKPLPVIVTTLLAPFGDAAPWLWLLLARAAGIGAVVVAARLAWRLAPLRMRVPAALAAGIGLVLTAGVARGVAHGYSEGLLVLCLLLAVERHLDGRDDHAFALGVAAALLRPEAWPFLVAGAAVAWRRRLVPRGLLAAGLVAVPILWFLPELWGSGNLLRSAERAVIVEPGAPALADHPALTSLASFAVLAPVTLAIGAAIALFAAGPRRERLPAALVALSLAWAGVVAAMGELGFSGEDRYLIPAAAGVVVAGAVGWSRLLARLRPSLAPAALCAIALLPLPFAIGPAADLGRDLAQDAELTADIRPAVSSAGGASQLLACGHLAAGRYRFPRLAWALGVPISALSLDPRPAGVVLRSRHRPDEPPEPDVPPGYRSLGASGRWEVLSSCA